MRWNPFWLRSLLFISLLAAILAALYAYAAPRYPSYYQPHQKVRRALAAPQTAHTLVLGSSHARLIDPQVGGAPGINLSHAGADLFEISYLMDWARNDLTALQTVVVAISYFSSSYDNQAFWQRGSNSRADIRRRVYATVPIFRPIPGDGKLLLQAKLYPLITTDHWRRLIAPEATPATPSLRHDGSSSDRVPEMEEAALRAHAAQRCGDQHAILRNMARRHPAVAEDASRVFEQAVRALQQAGIRVVLLVAPVHGAFEECFSQVHRQRTFDMLDRLRQQQGIPVFNLSRDASFHGHFANSDHLDAEGGRRLNQLLTRLIALVAYPGEVPNCSVSECS